MDKYYDRIIHGGDYNPDQWVDTKEIWDEDMRLMDLAKVNSATVGIFAWSLLEPEEGVYNFGWLDEIMDKLASHGKKAILATPSGARPPWMAQKYPEVLRVEESGVRNEYGVRHNHCLTSPVYREKTAAINRMLAQRYKDHPALFMWHISNEYSGECHCELCQKAFREWLQKEYGTLDRLNFKWWNGFWSHRFTSWDQISSPKYRGENHVPALRLAWRRFTTQQHLSFYLNEIAPLREITPDVPVTTNMMRLYKGIDYHSFAPYVDVISWDNYPDWTNGDNTESANETAFVHDYFRSMKDGKPFYMMESTPSIVNWKGVNRQLKSGVQELSAIQAVAHGADSVQYFQWRKSRGGHEKFHGAVVDHVGHENTRVFRDVARLGAVLEKLDAVVGARTTAKAAILYDRENSWAVDFFCGYHRDRRDYDKVCERWYRAFWSRGIPVDVISADQDFDRYDLIAAPFLYMVRAGTAERIERYVRGGGRWIGTYLTGIADEDDLCYLGGFPGGGLRKVFGVWAEETDSLDEGEYNLVSFGGRTYRAEYTCDVIHAEGATALGEYRTASYYAGTPAVTKNAYGNGEAYYVAFRPQQDFIDDFCGGLIDEMQIQPDAAFPLPEGVSTRKRGELLFVMNFGGEEKTVVLDREYRDVAADRTVSGEITLPENGYLILR